MAAKSFPYFSLLPAEIRIQIWSYVTSPRLMECLVYPDEWIDLRDQLAPQKPDTDQMIVFGPPPPLLSFHPESHEAVIKQYSRYLKAYDSATESYSEKMERLEWRCRLKDKRLLGSRSNFPVPFTGSDSDVEGTRLLFDLNVDIFYLNDCAQFWEAWDLEFTDTWSYNPIYAWNLVRLERWISLEFIKSIKYLAMSTSTFCDDGIMYSSEWLSKWQSLEILVITVYPKPFHYFWINHGEKVLYEKSVDIAEEFVGGYLERVASQYPGWKAPKLLVLKNRDSLERRWSCILEGKA